MSDGAMKNPFEPIYRELNNPPADGVERDFPVCIDVELTNRCNLRCIMCPTGIGALKRPQGFMSDDTYMKLLRDISGHQVGLRFIRWGEPTLHPKMCEYIELAKREGHLCHINTNGVLLEPMIDRLFDCGLDSIKFSFQGVNAESYGRMRQGSNFDTVVSNIIRLFEARTGDLPFIHVATTTTDESEDEIAAFKEKLTRYCDYISVGSTIFAHIDVERSGLDDEQKRRFNELKKGQKIITRRLRRCPEVFAKLSVDWDGKVSACCGDFNREMIIGDMNDTSIRDIFNGGRAAAYREILSRNAFNEIPRCSGCYDHMLIQDK